MRQETLLPNLGSYPNAEIVQGRRRKVPKRPFTEQGEISHDTENNRTHVNHEARKRGLCQRKRGDT
jgi:hypothetical protein